MFVHACTSPIFGDVWLLLVSKPHHSTTPESLLRLVYRAAWDFDFGHLICLLVCVDLPLFRRFSDGESGQTGVAAAVTQSLDRQKCQTFLGTTACLQSHRARFLLPRILLLPGSAGTQVRVILAGSRLVIPVFIRFVGRRLD